MCELKATLDRDHWRATVNKVMYLRGPIKDGEFPDQPKDYELLRKVFGLCILLFALFI
jgi:hypothetical protein